MAAVACCFLLGAACLAVAVWGTVHQGGSSLPIRSVPPEAGFVAGPIFIGLAVAEAVHRLRSGPQPGGRHARASATD
ncbi:hypothetical protein GCM10027601_02540 [Nocardioides ungokensis]